MIWRKGVQSPKVSALLEVLMAERSGHGPASTPPVRGKNGKRRDRV
jgi:hypothetical protein